MKTGRKEKHMSLKTRLSGKSESNSSLEIRDEDGSLIASVKVLEGSPSITLEITTKAGLHIEKPNGFRSK